MSTGETGDGEGKRPGGGVPGDSGGSPRPAAETRTNRRHRQRPRLNPLHPQSLWSSIRARPRLIYAVLTGLLVAFLLPGELSGNVRAAGGWIAAALCYIVFAVHAMATSDHHTIANRADADDESRTVILAMLILAISVNFVSIIGVMSEAKQAAGATRAALVVLAASTLAVSWSVMQVLFALHYAHEYYRPDDATGQRSHGLEFPGEEKPDYWDFLYFATSIGAASQTSDTTVRSRTMRRLVTAHSIISFFYNSAILALTINLAASLL